MKEMKLDMCFHLLFCKSKRQMADQKGYPTAKWKAKSRLNLG